MSWNFGDGTTSSSINPIHAFNLPGTYTVSLKSANNFGCADSIKKPFTIFNTPSINFTSTDTAGCPSFCTNYNGINLSPLDPISTWVWQFNNGFNDVKYGQNTLFCYNEDGLYSPTLIATNSHGCKDTTTKSQYIHVYAKPSANFNYSPQEIEVYEPFVNVQDNSSSDVVSWVWSFGDNTVIANQKPPSHEYAFNSVDANYNITLIVTNKNGCSSSIVHSVFARADDAIYIPNAFTPNEDNINDVFIPIFSGIYQNAIFDMTIYNRWGNAVYQTDNPYKGWSGLSKGVACEADVYSYVIKFYSKEDDSLIKKLVGKIILLL